MKSRIFTAIIGVTILFTVMLLGRRVFSTAVFLAAIVGLYELYKSFEAKNHRPVKAVGYLCCTILLIVGYTETLPNLDQSSIILHVLITGGVAMFLLYFTMMCNVFGFKKYTYVDIAITIFSVFYVVCGFFFLVLIYNLPQGNILIWLAFVSAWTTDIFAFLVGRKLGKHKVLPHISPKKSLEGCIGGWLGCVASTVVYGYIFNKIAAVDISILHFIAIGVIVGVISQFGDWVASALKRQANIKDFGNIFPGHGGILDRFDSIIFIAPFLYFYLAFIQIV